MYLNSIGWVDMHWLQHPARCVRANGDCTQVKGPILPTNLLEHIAIAGIASKPEALGLAQHSPAAPQALVLVTPACPGTGVLKQQSTCQSS